MTYIDTADMDASGFVSTIPAMPAEDCTEIGAEDYDDAPPEGAAIVALFAIFAVACAAALIALT